MTEAKQDNKMFISNYNGEKYTDFPKQGAEPGDFDKLLSWCKDRKAADITFQTDQPVWADINGKWSRITERNPTSTEIEGFIRRACGDNSVSLLKSGRDLDPAYEINMSSEKRDEDGNIIYTYSGTTEPKNENDTPEITRTLERYRLNITCGRAKGGEGFQLTFRALPKTPATLPALPDIEPELLDMNMIRPPNGLTLVTGPTGSGKSTFLYGTLRYIMEDENSYEKILDYSSPIEYTFDDVDFPNSYIHQILVGRPGGLHDPDSTAERADWAYAIRNALRRKPSIINIGESLDAATFSGCLQAALSGHMTFSTLHTIGVAATIRRALGFYNSDERRGVALDMLQALKYTITQQLIPRADGRGKIAIREYLYFNTPIVNVLSRYEPEEWPTIINKIMFMPPEERKECGVISQTLSEISLKLYQDGIISESVCEKYQVNRGEENRLYDYLNRQQ